MNVIERMPNIIGDVHIEAWLPNGTYTNGVTHGFVVTNIAMSFWMG